MAEEPGRRGAGDEDNELVKVVSEGSRARDRYAEQVVVGHKDKSTEIDPCYEGCEHEDQHSESCCIDGVANPPSDKGTDDQDQAGDGVEHGAKPPDET